MAVSWYVAIIPRPLSGVNRRNLVEAWGGWIGQEIGSIIPPVCLHLAFSSPDQARLQEVGKAREILTDRIGHLLGQELRWQPCVPETALHRVLTSPGEPGPDCPCGGPLDTQRRALHLRDGEVWLPDIREVYGPETASVPLTWAPTVVLSTSGAVVPAYLHTIGG